MNDKLNNRLWLRIALSPFIFIWGLIVLAVGSLFAILPILVVLSVLGLLATPIIALMIKSGSSINYPEPFLTKGDDYDNNKNIMRDHFFGTTIHLWGAFAIMIYYIKTGEVFTLN